MSDNADIPLDAFPAPEPSGRETVVDLTGPGLPDAGPQPPPVPDGPIREIHGFTFSYDRTALAFRWVRDWRGAAGLGLAHRDQVIVFAGKAGLTLSGFAPDLDASEADDLIAVLQLARQAAVWMIHGERPEYVLEYLDDSSTVDGV